jgi:agmatine/peptidylarginine deiminase
MSDRIGTVVSLPLLLLAGGSALADPGPEQQSFWNEELNGPLPRWRETGTPPPDPNQSLVPYAVTRHPAFQVPTSGDIVSPPEYAPCAGVVFRYSSGAWPTEVTDCVTALTAPPEHDEIAYVVVSSASQQTLATNAFTAAGADMSKVVFFRQPNDSIWLRDYGPHFITQDGALGIVDSHYYPTRPLDNFIPTLIADDEFEIPSYDIGLYYSGGNFQPGPADSGFMTALIHLDNPDHPEWFIQQLVMAYQGVETLHILPQLPFSVDGTGHIDMWFYIVDEDTVIISEFLPGENPTAINVTNNAVPYMEALGFEVFRVPALNDWNPGGSNTHYTYTNAYRVNDRIFIPSYGVGGGAHIARDADALATWQAAAPEAEIVQINCWNIIWAAGAIHCIMMQVPRYESPVPAAHVISPDGGEVLVAGTTHDLQWAATDDVAVTSVDLSYSTDGGITFPYPIATGEANDGHYDWTVPATVSDQVVVRVEANDGDSNVGIGDSADTAKITGTMRSVYDFSVNAGVDRWAWGTQTGSWASNVRANRYPVVSELTSTNYARLSTSNATGGDSDTGRYITGFPSSGFETTHVFEFTIAEDPALILDIGILWEGYGDDCTQMEMYVWNEFRGAWADALGWYGENRFMDNFAGNRDETLEGHIDGSFGDYLDPDGLLTILLYGERSGDRSFHDYMAVTVVHRLPADLDGDGVVGVSDFLLLLAVWGPCADPDDCPADLDGSGDVGVNDFLLLLAAWT